jgi:hypothetical protein
VNGVERLVDRMRAITREGAQRRIAWLDKNQEDLYAELAEAVAKHPPRGKLRIARVIDVGRNTVTVRCPFCEEAHQHGFSRDTTLPDTWVAHCVYARPRHRPDRPRRTADELERVPNDETRSYIVIDLDGLTRCPGGGGTSSSADPG